MPRMRGKSSMGRKITRAMQGFPRSAERHRVFLRDAPLSLDDEARAPVR
jgi:hypothetical protein